MRCIRNNVLETHDAVETCDTVEKMHLKTRDAVQPLQKNAVETQGKLKKCSRNNCITTNYITITCIAVD
jgi:hypothetical protein